MNEKWQVAVYLIHETNKITKEVYLTLDDSNKTYSQKQQKILRKLLNIENSHKYSSQKLVSNEKNGFELYLFYRKHPKSVPSWKSFLSSNVQENETIKIEPRNMNESFVLFLYHKEDKQLYAISGGYGAFTIQNHIQDDFGINILIRIVNSKGDKVLKHAREFGVTGGLVGVSKYFRKEFNFYENKNFGNIYREISAHLDKDTARLLGINIEDSKQCIAKSSFKLNQSITFDEMLSIVHNLNNIIGRDANFSVNDIKQLDIKRDEVLIKELNEKVINNIWSNKDDLSVFEESLDFIHKDFENFLLAKKFKCCREVHENILTLFPWIIEKISHEDEPNFRKKINSSHIISLDEEDQELTSDKVINHLVYEISQDEESYFLINGKYYQITNAFTNHLNESCKDFIIKNYDNGLDKNWVDTDTEGVYNLSYKDEDKTVVLDTITPEYIEPCDVLKYDDEYVYLYHVKKGFNGSMRDLTNQVFIAANRILEDLKSDKNYLKSVYAKMQNMDNYKDQVASEEEFLSIFSGRNLCFVLAVKDSGTNRRLDDIERFTSNIAKFSLNELINNMRNLDVPFRITQINRPDEGN